jgi:hypothetical protein
MSSRSLSLLAKVCRKMGSDVVEREMKVTAPAFPSFQKKLSKKHLISFDFDKLKSEVQQNAPILWELLQNTARVEHEHE